MRKRARGAADVPPSPTLSRPLHSDAKRNPRRKCLRCRINDAKALLQETTSLASHIFCSLICASEFAIAEVMGSDLMWCEKHKRWTTPDGECPLCEVEKTADKPGSCVRRVDDSAEGKGVPHGS